MFVQPTSSSNFLKYQFTTSALRKVLIILYVFWEFCYFLSVIFFYLKEIHWNNNSAVAYSNLLICHDSTGVTVIMTKLFPIIVVKERMNTELAFKCQIAIAEGSYTVRAQEFRDKGVSSILYDFIVRNTSINLHHNCCVLVQPRFSSFYLGSHRFDWHILL